jgi:hypothetical protein
MGICPVLYSYAGSLSSDYIRALLQTLVGDMKLPGVDDLIWRILKFVKPYEGVLLRESHRKKWVRFYDEREWRFMPNIAKSSKEYRQSLSAEEYRTEDELAKHNRTIEVRDFRLSFSPSDIRYVIVSREAEIKEMMDALLEIKGGSFSYDDVRMLTTRIISLEQVKEDF